MSILRDFRLVLRKLLTITSDAKQLIEDLSTFKEAVKSRLESEHLVTLVERIETRIEHIISDALFGIVNDYCKLKLLTNPELFCVLQQAFEKALNSLLQRIKRYSAR